LPRAVGRRAERKWSLLKVLMVLRVVVVAVKAWAECDRGHRTSSAEWLSSPEPHDDYSGQSVTAGLA
jgi:hypothetical protein